MTLLQKEYNDVAYISGPLLFVNAASDLAYGAIVNIKDASGKLRGGQVISVTDQNAVIQVFEETRGLDLATASVSLVEDVARLGVSKEMIGRRFDGLGRPIDGLPAVVAEKRLSINGQPMNPAARAKLIGVQVHRLAEGRLGVAARLVADLLTGATLVDFLPAMAVAVVATAGH